ncbi:FMRFamide receptor-like [Ruditapes philippinarum]|uniref:FMRFamide receptor-like n=1 Tax=Ruditapes philippinarum TaxID=129788 RepID=UPI00295BD903|nr:FMRFamide receptor-like [Ruditapes philippinarum]
MADNITDTNASSEQMEQCGSPTVVTFQYYAWGIGANIISCFGIVGNILSIMVLSHRQMRNSTSYYLISLAVYDMILLLFMSLFLALPTIYLEKDLLEGYYFAYRYMHPFVYPVALIAQTGTVYTTLAFTVERYIAVCKPLHAANTCTMSRTKRVIVVIFIASIVYNIPRFLEYKTTTIWDDYYNRTIPTIEYTTIGSNKMFQEVYFIYAYLCIMFLLPFSVLTVLNILLIQAVRKARAKRNCMSSSNSKDTNLTVMLIVVINVFLGCQLPALIDNIVFAIFDHHVLQCSVPWVQFTTISNLLVVFNSAINFILYCLLSKRFRRLFLKRFCIRKKRTKVQVHVFSAPEFSLHTEWTYSCVWKQHDQCV